MKHTFTHLLVILQNHADDEQVLSRAISLARQYHSELTLFCSWYGRRKQTGLAQQAAQYRQQLLQQTSQAKLPTAKTNIIIDWQQPAQRAIEPILQQREISLIIKLQQPRRSVLSWLVPDMEHYFISSCDLPVWLVKQRTASSELSILACLDVDGSAQQQYQLNDAILSIGEQLVQQDSKQLHILNCYQTDDYSMSLPYDSNHGFAPLPDVQQQHNDKLTPYIAEHQLTAETVHLSEGLPDDEIPKAVQNYHCQLAIIGNSHPHNFSSVLFGDTAHYLSRHTPCDVLIVKQLA